MKPTVKGTPVLYLPYLLCAPWVCKVSHIFVWNTGKETALPYVAWRFATPTLARQDASAVFLVSASSEQSFRKLVSLTVSHFKNCQHWLSSIHPGALTARRNSLAIAEQFWMQLSNVLLKNCHQMHMPSCIFINYLQSSANNKGDGRKGGNTK